MSKRPSGLLVTLLGTAVVVTGAFVFGLQGHTDDADTARAFLTHAAAGEMDEAHALLHASITQHRSVEDVSEILSGMDVYTSIDFPSVNFSTSNGNRATDLTGTGTTDGGCESALQFDLLNGDITAFEIRPLCRAGASDA